MYDTVAVCCCVYDTVTVCCCVYDTVVVCCSVYNTVAVCCCVYISDLGLKNVPSFQAISQSRDLITYQASKRYLRDGIESRFKLPSDISALGLNHLPSS